MSISTSLEKWFLCSCGCLYYYTDHYTDSHSSYRSISEAGVWLQAQKCPSPGYQSLHCFHCQSCGHWRCRLPAAAAVAVQPGQRWPGRRPAQWQVTVVPSLGNESLWTVRTLPQSLQRHLTILNNWPSDTLESSITEKVTPTSFDARISWQSNTNLIWCQHKSWQSNISLFWCQCRSWQSNISLFWCQCRSWQSNINLFWCQCRSWQSNISLFWCQCRSWQSNLAKQHQPLLMPV